MTVTIPKGTYKARATGAVDYGKSSKGSDQVSVTFALVDGEHASREITWVGNFGNEKGIEIGLKALRACGWKGDDITNLEGVTDNEVSLVIEEEEWEGEWHSRVKWVNSGGKFAFKNQLDPGGRAAFAARIKGAAVQSRIETEKQRAAAPESGAPLPF